MSIAAHFSAQTWQVLDERQPLHGEFNVVEFQELEDTVARTSSNFQSFDEHARKFAGKRKHMPAQMAERLERAEEVRQAEEAVTVRLKPEELEALQKQAYDEGFEQARQEVTQKNLEKFESLERRIVTVLEDIRSQQQQNFNLLEQQALAFSVQLAKKLVDQIVEVNPEYIVPLIKRSVRLSAGAKISKIRVSPQDFEFLQVIGVQKLFTESEDSMKFEPDDSVRAGCIVETSAGEIDANLDESFERIRDSILITKRS